MRPSKRMFTCGFIYYLTVIDKYNRRFKPFTQKGVDKVHDVDGWLGDKMKLLEPGRNANFKKILAMLSKKVPEAP